MEKQRLLYQQSRLHNRGAAEMVLQMISACKGTCLSTGHSVPPSTPTLFTLFSPLMVLPFPVNTVGCTLQACHLHT
jgi:hypothetical protein